jgi:hypothetical protein
MKDKKFEHLNISLDFPESLQEGQVVLTSTGAHTHNFDPIVTNTLTTTTPSTGVKLRRHDGSNWQSFDPLGNISTTGFGNNTGRNDLAYRDLFKELNDAKAESDALKIKVAELLEIVQKSSSGDVFFAKGYKSMTMDEIKADIADAKARYDEDGMVLSRFVYIPNQPVFIGIIDGVEVFTCFPVNDSIITLEDLRKASQKFRDMLVNK